MNSPKVTIFVPCYNHERFVTTLIESIYNQPFKDFELIVIDDGSKDKSPEILKALAEKYHFQLVLKQNEGLCKTLNKGISLAKGEYFTGIASDDFIPANRLVEQVEFLNSRRDVDVVAGSEIIVDNNNVECGRKDPKIRGFISFEEMIKINRVLAATVMMRTSVFKRFGTYDESHVFEDYYMWLKVLRSGGTIYNTTNMWAYYRISNPDLEKKFNWYYKGAVQALSDYKEIPFVENQLEKHKTVYCIKLALLLGINAKIKYPEIFKSLNVKGKLITFCIGILPSYIRNKAMILLKLKTE